MALVRSLKTLTAHDTSRRLAMAGTCGLQSVACSVACRLGFGFGSTQPSRSYGAAALEVYDYHDDEEEEELPELGLEPDGSVPERGVQWVVMGYPGVERHACAARLSKLLEVPHITMGSLLRQDLSPRSSLYKLMANALNEGKLVPGDIIFGLLSNRLEERNYRGETGFILDGIPRTCIQAEILDEIAEVDLVVNFKSTEECLMKKHLGNGVCKHCGNSTGLCNLGSSGLSICPSALLRHTQVNLCAMNAEAVRKEKLRIYSEQSKPLEDYYRKQKKLLDFKVAGGTRETWQGLLAALHLQHMDTIGSSQKLTP